MNGSAHCSNVSLTVRGDSRKRKRKISFRVWMIPPFGWQFYLPLSPHGRNGKVIIARKECHGSDEQRNIDLSVCKILQEFCNTKWFQVSISEEQKVGPGLIFQSMSKSTALIENTFYVHIKSGQNNLITMLQMQAWQTECRCVFRNDADMSKCNGSFWRTSEKSRLVSRKIDRAVGIPHRFSPFCSTQPPYPRVSIAFELARKKDDIGHVGRRWRCGCRRCFESLDFVLPPIFIQRAIPLPIKQW